jgi:hypothetical protein
LGFLVLAGGVFKSRLTTSLNGIGVCLVLFLGCTKSHSAMV